MRSKTKTTKNKPSDLMSCGSVIPALRSPSSDSVAFAFSNFVYPNSKIGSVNGFRVIALSIQTNAVFIIAGQTAKKRMYERTWITFIRFHIDFNDTAINKVTMICVIRLA